MEKHPQLFDVCIVCALPEEARAFLEVIQQQCEGAVDEYISPRHHYSYRFATLKNDKDELLSLHISWLPRYGPQEMTLHLSHVLEECRPRIAIMTGICAGDARHLQLGDLVVAERTFTYDNGKFTLDEYSRSVHEHDTMTYQLDANILQFLGLFDKWKPLIATLECPPSSSEQREEHDIQLPKKRREITCHVKPMASGSAVRADHPFEDVEAPVRGTVAIDMEGAAFGLVMSRHPLIRWLIVKGVCDYTDQDKNDTYHDYAARVSALYTLSFIQSYVTNERLPQQVASAVSDQGGSLSIWNIPLKPPRHISRRAVLIGGAATIGLAVGGVTLFAVFRPAIAVGTRLNFFEDTGAIRALAWSRDGRFIASANDDDTVPVWDVQANKLIYTCRGHSNHVEGVSWSPDGKYIVSGSADGTARIWDAQTAETRYIYTGHTVVDVNNHHPWVNRVQWSPDGTRIASCDQTSSGSNTATVQIWEAKTGKKLVTYREHKNGVYSVAWSPNNKSIASVGYDGILRVWEATSGKTMVAISESYPRWLFGVAWSPDSNRVAFGGTDYIVWVISPDGQQKAALYTLPHSQGLGIRDIAWSPKGKYIAVSTHYQGVHIIQSDTGTLVYANIDILVGDIAALGWSPTNARIASGNGFISPFQAGQVPAVQVWQAPTE